MRNSILPLLVFILLSCSCSDITAPFDLPIGPITNLDSLLIWKVPLDKDTLNSISEDVFYRSGKIITSVNPSSTSEDEIIFCFNTDGMELWRWLDYMPQIKPQDIVNSHLTNDKLIFSSGADNYCLDIITSEKIWAYYNENSYPIISISGINLVFKTLNFGITANKADSSKIMMAKSNEGVFEEIFKVIKHDAYEQFIPSVLAYINNDADTILAFQSRQYKLSPYDNRIDLYSYNLSKKEIMWVNYDITEIGGSNQLPPIEDEDHLYFAGQFNVFCFEKESGTLVWNRQLYHDFQGSNYLIYNDLFITNLDNGDLIAISKHNGETVWVQQGLSACCTELRIYEDKIYMGNGDLFIIQAETGEVLFRYKTPTKKEKGRSNALFLNAIAVDLENQRMYATDGYYLLCLKHPDL